VTKEWNDNTFSSSKTFYENISEVADLSLMKKALENVAILNTIEDEEMVTIFAITNKGFIKLQEKQDSIFDASKASLLTAIIKYHVIPGRVDSYSLKESVKRNNGLSYYATLQKEKLGIKEENGQLVLVDSDGNTSIISATDFYHKNGFFHIVDGIVLPKTEK
jgi:uncharacterized surface protein with fasciclin (FAS1) repeats